MLRRSLLLLPLLVLAAAAPAAARPVKCRSSDLRYAFAPGQPKFFGVHKLRVSGGGCRTARRVARRWKQRFEANLRGPDPKVKLPRFVLGFTFESLPAHAAQTYSERGRRGSTTIRFDYVVPNG